ncbi:MAG TPA: hypothetical protein VKB88_07995 [Bryobacteraceae bacterium]|nr:hypothetical protein [Bryobacteraceae bacterium]
MNSFLPRSPLLRVSAISFFVLLAGCSRYSNFTLPKLPGADPRLTFTFDEQAAPVFSALPKEALNPSMIRRGTDLIDVYSLFDGARWHTAVDSRILLSPDPRTWEGSYIAANGSALLVGGRIWYWYEAAPRGAHRIGLARDFHKLPQPVLDHGPYMSWDERVVADPYVIRIDPYFYMFYLGQDRAAPPRQRLGVARSRDGVDWEKLRSNPVLEPGPPGAFDENGLGEPAVFQYAGSYWMLYTGRDGAENRRLGLSRSNDGVHWEKLPAVFPGTRAWDSEVICDPTVLVENDQIRVWFGGGDVPRPDEGIHGQIGYGVLRPVR